MADNQSLIERIRKLAVIAEKGAGGEKEAAALLLERLMDKHGITESDLEEEPIEFEWFKYKDDLQRKLLHQVIYTVLGDRELYNWKGSRKKEVGVYCTAAEKTEIEITYDFYYRAIQEELETFLYAFYSKNHLFPPPNKKLIESNEPPISMEELMKISNMMDGMAKHTLKKMIAG